MPLPKEGVAEDENKGASTRGISSHPTKLSGKISGSLTSK